MSNFVAVIGWLIIAAIALALVFFAICCVLFFYDKAMERFARAVDAKARIEVGRAIGAAAWWFSEHPETSLAMLILAERIGDGTGIDPNQWREQWRKEMKSDSKRPPSA